MAKMIPDPMAVRGAINDAFDGAEHPGDTQLLVAPNHCRECQEAWLSYRGRDWRSLGVRAIKERKDTLSMLSPVGLRYFLPAFMIASLKERNEVDTAWHSLLGELTPPRSAAGAKRERLDRLAAGLTSRQRAAIRDFLAFFYSQDAKDLDRRDDERFRRAVEYWRGLAAAP